MPNDDLGPERFFLLLSDQRTVEITKLEADRAMSLTKSVLVLDCGGRFYKSHVIGVATENTPIVGRPFKPEELKPEPKCQHPTQEIRYLTTKDGRRIFIHQCVDCGWKGKMVKKKDVLKKFKGDAEKLAFIPPVETDEPPEPPTPEENDPGPQDEGASS